MNVPREIDYPPVEVALFDWWRGHYDHVFVALHPFHAVAEDGRGETDLDAVKAARPVRWAEAQAMIAGREAEDFRAFALAVWTVTLMTLREDAQLSLVAGVERLLAEKALMPPWQDILPPILERPVGAAFARLGAAELTAWDEERETPTPLTPADLEAAPSVARLMRSFGPFALHAPGLLVTSGTEDLYSFIAMTEAARALVTPEQHFEGFYAEPGTYCDWINPPDFFDRAPPGGG